VVETAGYEIQGEVVILKEVLDAERAIVTQRADEDRVGIIADPLRQVKLKIGDHLLIDAKSGYLLEKLPKSEVEDLSLEEVPDISYDDIGGLGTQLETIKDAQFFTNLTSENLAWRERVERILSSKTTERDNRTDQSFRAWSELALDRTLGTPAKAVIAGPARPTLIFATGRGVQPWQEAEESAVVPEEDLLFIRALEDSNRKALEASNRKPVDEKQPEIIEVKGATEPEGEPLELVQLPEPPELFNNPPPRERDRGR
jgi:Proteasomal ATPase OB C-terminal domain